VVISAVNQGDLNRMVSELQGCIEAAEPGANNHDLRRGFAVHLTPSPRFMAFKIFCAGRMCISL
jgi:hypothetical protein